MTRSAVVVGGGIAGLAAAFEFQRAGWAVTVHEAGDRWGGKIHTSPVGDRPVDAGPDAFLARVDHGYDLCRELGLDGELTSPVAPVPAYVHLNGKLHELPEATMLGVPTDLDLLKRSTLVSPAGIERATDDLTLSPTSLDPDPSVGEVCRQRLGDELTDRLIDPLIGAINASDIDRLSINAAAPQLAAALRSHGSLITGMAALRQAGAAALGSRDKAKPVFYGLPGGVARIIDGLVEELAGAASNPADLRLNSPVDDLDRFTRADADAVILAVPAFVAGKLLSGAPSEAHHRSAELLSEIDYADVAQVVVELPVEGLDRVLDASGILFPRVSGMMMTACTWLSTKWQHYRRDESVLIRMSTGRFGDTRHAALDDGELTGVLLAELGSVIGFERPPVATRVVRWNRAFPQYTPGHKDRLSELRSTLGTADPRIALVGAPYDGIGVPACIAAGRTAARNWIDS
ncbi:MAG: protoporphyrinogen oxidase [Acidimicrobiales bacterium]